MDNPEDINDIELSDIAEDIFNSSHFKAQAPEHQGPPAPQVKPAYNPRDPAASHQTTAFSAAFSNLKKSAFYEDPKTLQHTLSTAQSSSDQDASKATTSTGNNKSANVMVRSMAPGASRQTKSGPLLVSPRQRGNPLLKAICNVPWEYEETILADYQMGATTCALFLSLRYHNLNPDYIHERIKKLGKKFRLQVLVVQVDLVDPAHAIKHLNRLCLLADLTLMLAGSAEEAGRIIETYKMFENKPPEMIMEKKEEGMQSKVLNALTTVRSVNKTDAYTLLKTFESLENILHASPEALELCPGFGPQKARRLHTVLHQAFLRRA